MPVKRKKESGLYTYLEAQGILFSDCKEVVLNAKQRYWKEIRANWKKEKRKNSKAFTVYYSAEEFEKLQQLKPISSKSITGYIKEKSLSNILRLIPKESIGKMREDLLHELNGIETISRQTNCSAIQLTQIEEHLEKIEIYCMNILSSFIE